eukprot:Em0004g159a
MPEVARVSDTRADTRSTQCKTLCLIAIKVLVRVLLFSIVVTCTVFSKLSLISLVSRLNETIDNIHRTNDSEATVHNRAAGFFWQLLFIVLIPQFVTLFRALLFGVCGKQSRLFPWPTLRAIFTGAIASVFEVVAMTTVVFYVLPRLHSIVAILALGGVFGAQAILDCLEWCPCCVRKGYHKVGNGNINFNENEDQTNCLMEDCAEGNTGAWNKFSRIIAMFLQFVSVILLSIYASLLQSGPKDQFLVGCAMTLSLLSLSVVWSSKVQQGSQKMARMTQSSNVTHIRSANTNEKNQEPNVINEKEPILPTARFKANFINAILRIILYPFISYVIFRYVFTNGSIDPWCLHQTCSLTKSFQWKGQELAIFLIQILSSFFGYTFMWISCTMVLHRWGLALPLYLCTPISFAVCAIFQAHQDSSSFYFSKAYSDPVALGVAIVVGAMLWIGQILTMGAFIWKKKNLILAKDAAMFLTPCYDGVFLEQHTMLNRKVTKEEMSRQMVFDDDEPRPRTIFICSTMHMEDRDEMRCLLSSIYQLACHCKEKKNDDHFESHIFLDGGANETQLTYFALQLFSLFEETLHVDALHLEPKVFQRIDTPYGIQLSWEIAEVMPIYVHLKDSTKIKNKKRWSQVMYMNYVLNFREIRMDDDNTFILTTDADIEFTPESATVLLDIIDSDPQVGAACGRIHPKGSGVIYWYQVFEYAIGHWYLKVAEHILGTVLCCPGCFSVFRCSALRSVLDTFSTEVTSAREFLTKDMGEDRWLCTLLVKKGWKLEYCPTSENYTLCPESFDEFFKQRRRWISSTIANLALLITQASKVTKRNENVSILFMIFQGILMFSTAISPATVILVIASGSLLAFNISDSSILAIIIILSLLSIAYGILCLYGNPQQQLDVAKFATFVFAIIMGVVFVGTLKSIIYDFLTVGENYQPCTIKTTITSKCHNSTGFMVPLALTTLFQSLFIVLFTMSGLFHLNEFSSLFYGVWYFLALPSGYLILLIYTAANLNSRSWGTREGSSGAHQGGGFEKIKCLFNGWQKVPSCFNRGTREQKMVEENKQPPASCDAATAMSDDMDEMEQQPLIGLTDEAVENKYSNLVNEAEFKMTYKLKKWLRDNGFPQEYADTLEQHGYFNLNFVAGLQVKELQAIGFKDRGYVLRLERCAQKLAPFNVAINQTLLELSDVGTWLHSIELQGYQQLFKEAGYKTREDLENLKGLKRTDLEKMGIKKRAHIQRLLEGISKLTYLTEDEKRVYQIKSILEKEPDTDQHGEHSYWTKLLDVGKPLRPMAANLNSNRKLDESLRSLRNITIAFLLLINIMWVILLFTLRFPELYKFNLPPNAFELFSVAVYTLIFSVQFCAMIVHRGVTLIHYLASVGSATENCRTLLHMLQTRN